jgi:hypothetical protein
MKNLPELPPTFQAEFELAVSETEGAYTAAPIVGSPAQEMLDAFRRNAGIVRLFFRYLELARSACRAGKWTESQLRAAADGALPAIYDHFALRELGLDSEQAKLGRVALWKVIRSTVSYSRELEQHEAEIAALVNRELNSVRKTENSHGRHNRKSVNSAELCALRSEKRRQWRAETFPGDWSDVDIAREAGRAYKTINNWFEDGKVTSRNGYTRAGLLHAASRAQGKSLDLSVIPE